MVYNINKLDIHDGDKLLINFNENTDMDDCEEIVRLFCKALPKNMIIGVPFNSIANLTVISEEHNSNNKNYPF